MSDPMDEYGKAPNTIQSFLILVLILAVIFTFVAWYTKFQNKLQKVSIETTEIYLGDGGTE